VLELRSLADKEIIAAEPREQVSKQAVSLRSYEEIVPEVVSWWSETRSTGGLHVKIVYVK
jgi:hypothetical protein